MVQEVLAAEKSRARASCQMRHTDRALCRGYGGSRARLAHPGAGRPGDAPRRELQRRGQLLTHNDQAPAGVAVDLGQRRRAQRPGLAQPLWHRATKQAALFLHAMALRGVVAPLPLTQAHGILWECETAARNKAGQYCNALLGVGLMPTHLWDEVLSECSWHSLGWRDS